MKAAEEYQQLPLIKMFIIGLLTVMMMIGLMTGRAAADEVFPDSPAIVLTTGDDRVELPARKRQQFRAKLIRNWWQVKQPKYVIYRSLFQKR